MSLFWQHRLQRVDNEAGWTLSFADLMSLLLAVFVMIAAMGDWQTGTGFQKVSEGLRKAFGASMFTMNKSAARKPPTPNSLVQRLQRVGVGVPAAVQLSDGAASDLPPCRMVAQANQMVLQMDLAVCFAAEGAVLTPGGMRLVARVGEYLQDGEPKVMVRCPVGQAPLSSDLPWRDRWDQAYERARSVTQALMQVGVSPQRLEVTTGAEPAEATASPGAASSVPAGSAVAPPAVEIVVTFAGARTVNNSSPGESR